MYNQGILLYTRCIFVTLAPEGGGSLTLELILVSKFGNLLEGFEPSELNNYFESRRPVVIIGLLGLTRCSSACVCGCVCGHGGGYACVREGVRELGCE